MKSYRSRTLNTRCQVAQADPQGNPLRDEGGNPVLDHGGLWFRVISGNSHHDRKRILPEDHEAFFRRKAKEIEDALKADGVADAVVAADEVYAEYVGTFTKPNHTYAPPGRPEEFSLVLPKELVVNIRGGVGVGGGVGRPGLVPAQATSIFARLKAGKGPANGHAEDPTARKKGRSRQPQVAATTPEDGVEVDLDELLGR
jgi:hypothetical protein